MGDDRQRSVKPVQRMEVFRQRNSGAENRNSSNNDPKRRKEAAQSEPMRLNFLASEDGRDGDPRESDPVEDALCRIRRPDGGEDQPIANAKLGNIADARVGAHDTRVDHNAIILASSVGAYARDARGVR